MNLARWDTYGNPCKVRVRHSTQFNIQLIHAIDDNDPRPEYPIVVCLHDSSLLDSFYKLVTWRPIPDYRCSAPMTLPGPLSPKAGSEWETFIPIGLVACEAERFLVVVAACAAGFAGEDMRATWSSR
jgi:hypothetical protein